ncbi:zf-HC2 domain-containing protein [Streptomyces yunnanensis]|uniref:Zinc-finger n=1 Tax=Streptomyces yunnanensis TaxID=156453 RepID=A0A9X8N2Q8_9ACTN|nr:zf-HC2 domain-containing protein [Streptomyces yunnanensis]SHM77278.1 hypothetical protein SAMN05216268_11470 [Streptomyces yunnanensis]
MLSGRERAEATAHLDRCAECREYIGQLALVGDGLLGLLPGSEPPASEPGAGFRRGIRLRVASAVAVLALGFGFGGWALGSAIEDVVAGSAQSTQTVAGVLHTQLTGTGAGHRQTAGHLYVHPGSPGWIFMSVDLADAGIPYSGTVTCLLERTDGLTVRLGSFRLHEGDGYWGGPASLNATTLSHIRLTSADGHDLATAHFSPR